MTVVFPETTSLAIDRYEYVPERGMYASANRPELVGRRYDLLDRLEGGAGCRQAADVI